MTSTVLENYVSFEGVGSANIDREAGIVRDVKVIGFRSKNGREYTPESLKNGVPLYEGAKVNLDHPQKATQARSVRDRFGVLRNVRFVEGNGNRGDFHFNPKHAYADQFIWEVENNPSNVGFSHNAMVDGGRKGQTLVVESIQRVLSVDLVADPATTDGVFESTDAEEGVISDKLKADKEHTAFRKTVDAAISLIRHTLWNDEVTLAVAKSNVQTIATDLVAELSKTPEQTQEDEDMDLSKLTLEELKTARPDLLTAQEQTDELEALRKKVSTMEAEKAESAFKDKVRAEVKASKLTEEQASKAFMNVLFTTEDDASRAALILDRETLCEGLEPKSGNTGTKKPVSAVTEGQGGGATSITPTGLASALATM